jgi:putative restriction endonuclease
MVTSDRPLMSRRSNTDIPRTELREKHAVGGFTEPVLASIKQDPKMAGDIAKRLLDGHFPSSLHSDLLDAVGLCISGVGSARRPRDVAFRKEVLRAYERRCAVCGFDLRIADQTIGLEAAHIKWHQASGPDEVANGLALCTIHHKLFDLGAFTILESSRLAVSEHVTGTGQFDHILLRHHMTEISKPLRSAYEPNSVFLKWHRDQVFKSPSRS